MCTVFLIEVLSENLHIYLTQQSLISACALSVWVAESFAFLTSDHKVLGSNPSRGAIQIMTVKCFIAHVL